MAITLEPELITRLVREALAEDRATEDATTLALVTPDQRGRGAIVAKAPGVIAGLAFAQSAFRQVDADILWRPATADGETVAPGDTVAIVEGSPDGLLRAERTALNFLTHLSGIATSATAIVELLEGTGCRLRDTRKTIPGLRLAEKYAAQTGGAETFRTDLADAVLIKDNHLAAARTRGLTIAQVIEGARAGAPEGMPVEIEVTSVAEAREALAGDADIVLLDNMPVEEMRTVVEVARGRALIEASGGVTEENVRAIAETGVDRCSAGAITHSAPALDISMEVKTAAS